MQVLSRNILVETPLLKTGDLRGMRGFLHSRLKSVSLYTLGGQPWIWWHWFMLWRLWSMRSDRASGLFLEQRAMTDVFLKPSKAEQDLKWAKIWFSKLCAFHQKPQRQEWDFGKDDVIAFLQSKRDAGVPAWKRMKVIEGLLLHRRLVQDLPIDHLLPIKEKMGEIILIERARDDDYDTIEDVVGFIDPRECDAIAEFRRGLRRAGMKQGTERSYVSKLRKFMGERGLTCLADFDRIGGSDVEAHLTDLAVDGNVAPSSQNGSFFALLKFFELVLKREMGQIEAVRATKGKMVPTVLSPSEVVHVFDGLRGVYLLIAMLLYGCGMRISEAMRLRMKDIDFENKRIEIHKSKGDKSRTVPLPEELVAPLKRMMKSREVLHEHDLADGTASVWLPNALSRKYPSAHRELRWQFLFASDRLSRDPRTRRLHRHHLQGETFSTHLRRAVELAGILKHVTSHTFRHCFATHLLWTGTDIRMVQELLGHSDVKTTMIYTHVVNQASVTSPLDRLKVMATASESMDTKSNDGAVVSDSGSDAKDAFSGEQSCGVMVASVDSAERGWGGRLLRWIAG